jgi:hypothetical protein
MSETTDVHTVKVVGETRYSPSPMVLGFVFGTGASICAFAGVWQLIPCLTFLYVGMLVEWYADLTQSSSPKTGQVHERDTHL